MNRQIFQALEGLTETYFAGNLIILGIMLKNGVSFP